MVKLMALTKRNMKLFLRDRAAVFFSFLSILIVFFLNILFIGNNIQNGISQSLSNGGFPVSENLIKLFSNSWMVSGVIGVGTVTIANGSIAILVHDNMTNAKADFYVTPTHRVLLILSYFFSTVLVTFLMSVAMVAIVYGYLIINGMTALAFVDLLSIIGIVLLSTLSSTMIITTIALVIKTDNLYSIVSSIMSILIGFTTGAYMPMSFFPQAVGDVCNFIPATGTVVILRQLFMKTVITDMNEAVPAEVTNGLLKEFGTSLNIGSWSVPNFAIVLYLLFSIIVFLVIATFIIRKAKNK